MAVDDLAGVLLATIARNESRRRWDPRWRRLLMILASIARDTTHGRVLAVKTRAGLLVPGVAAADIERQLVTMSGYLWAADPSLPAAEQEPLITPVGDHEIRRVLAAYGVLMHELGHILCSKLAVLLALDRAGMRREYGLLEEPRMEASMGRRALWYRGCFGYSFAAHRLPQLADALSGAQLLPLVDIALRMLGAEHGHLLPATVARACREQLAAALEPDQFAALDHLASDIVAVGDGDEAGMHACCERLRELLDEAGEPPDGDQLSESTDSESAAPVSDSPGGDGTSSHNGARTTDIAQSDDNPDGSFAGKCTSLNGAALVEAVDEALGELSVDEWHPMGDALEHVEAVVAQVDARLATLEPGEPSPARGPRGLAAGLPGRPFDPVAGWRRPTAEERAIARDIHRRIAAVPATRDERLQTRFPPGRIDFTELVRQEAQLARGLSPSADPFGRIERVRGLMRDPLFLVLVDCSFSMRGWARLAIGMGWAIADGARSLRGRVAVVSFGNQATGLIDPATRPDRVPIIAADGGTAHIHEAFDIGAARLNMLDTNATRVLAVISDGDWHYPASDRRRLRPYLRSGMRALTVCAGKEPQHAVGASVRIDTAADLGAALAQVLIDAVLADRGQRANSVGRRRASHHSPHSKGHS